MAWQVKWESATYRAGYTPKAEHAGRTTAHRRGGNCTISRNALGRTEGGLPVADQALSSTQYGSDWMKRLSRPSRAVEKAGPNSWRAAPARAWATWRA
jgi:hypothetical protein